MAYVKILCEGYTVDEEGGGSCSTIVLVKDGDTNIVIDPGTAKSRDVITKALEGNGLTADDIGIVFITHSHMDHYRNIGMFPRAKALDYWGWWTGDVWNECDGKVTEDIRIIRTPGHSYDGMTMLVETENGTVAICGDVFWKEGLPKEDHYASDGKALARSRKLVMQSADFVIPGHGSMFPAKRQNA